MKLCIVTQFGMINQVEKFILCLNEKKNKKTEKRDISKKVLIAMSNQIGNMSNKNRDFMGHMHVLQCKKNYSQHCVCVPESRLACSQMQAQLPQVGSHQAFFQCCCT